MHTNESRRHAERMMLSLGATKGVEPGKIGEVEKFNPYHDEAGRFTFSPETARASNISTPAERSASRKSEDSLWQHTEDYHRASEKAGKKGERGPFLHYKAKDTHTGDESEQWKKLNTKIGELEAKANAYEKWLKISAKADTGEKRKFLLAMMQTNRDAAKQMAKQRDRQKPAATEKNLMKEIPPLLQDVFDTADDGVDGDSAMSPEEIKDYKKQAVRIAIDSGLLSEEDAEEILAGLEG
jgi:hypothetical protein